VEARDEEPVSDTAIPSMINSSSARRVSIDALGCRMPPGFVSAASINGDAFTAVLGGDADREGAGG
jgi:hypothetical protein